MSDEYLNLFEIIFHTNIIVDYRTKIYNPNPFNEISFTALTK